MLDVLNPIKSHFTLTTKPRGEGFVFILHYRATFALIMAACILVTATQYIGDPIECMPDRDSLPQQVIDSYCYITSTYTLPKHYDRQVGVEVPHWGVGPELPEDDKVFHNYYIWVPYMLFLQAVSFYVPHWLWKATQTDKVYTILMGLDGRAIDDAERKSKEKLLVNYLMSHLHMHNLWAAKYVFCEVLNFANVLIQISVIDAFLGGEFTTYGPEVARFLADDPRNRTDPMYEIFPRVTKCKFWKYGPSGTVQRHDALCVLALNIINEKIYVILWFWLVILAILSGLALLYRLATVFSPSVRAWMLRTHTGTSDRPGGSVVRASDVIDSVVHRCQYGDWYLLHSLGRSMSSVTYLEVLKGLSKKMNGSAPVDSELDLKMMDDVDTTTKV